MSYYIYGLVDPREEAESPETSGLSAVTKRLASIFYVGKGAGQRSSAHLAEAREALQQEQEFASDAAYSAKIQQIIDLISAGQVPEEIKLAAGFAEEKDAYRAEAMAIETVSAVRETAGRPPLTNAVKGHGIAVENLHTGYFRRMHVDEVVLGEELPCEPFILVKGTAEDMADEWEYEAVTCGREEVLAEFPDDVWGQISVMKEVAQLPLRRGWDPHQPWEEPEARARACRYWPISKERIVRWIRDHGAAPRHLLLAIAGSEGTAVHYAWEIDPAGRWDRYDGGQWGVPLKQQTQQHPLLNKVLKEYRPTSGSPVQVLQNYSAGIRIFDV